MINARAITDVTKVIKLERATLHQSHCPSSNLCRVLTEIR